MYENERIKKSVTNEWKQAQLHQSKVAPGIINTTYYPWLYENSRVAKSEGEQKLKSESWENFLIFSNTSAKKSSADLIPNSFCLKIRYYSLVAPD